MIAEEGIIIRSMVQPDGNGCEERQSIGRDSSRSTVPGDERSGMGCGKILAQPPGLVMRSVPELSVHGWTFAGKLMSLKEFYRA